MKEILIALYLALAAASAQEVPQTHDMSQGSEQHEMAGIDMKMDEHAHVELPSPHQGSGTS